MLSHIYICDIRTYKCTRILDRDYKALHYYYIYGTLTLDLRHRYPIPHTVMRNYNYIRIHHEIDMFHFRLKQIVEYSD